MRLARFVAVVAGAALSLPAAASASHLNLSVSVVGPGDLVAGVQVLLPVEVTCDPIPPSPFAFANVQITLRQRAGREIALASGSLVPVCDGAPHLYEVAITPGAPPFGGSLAFHGGRAVASISGMICAFNPVTFQQDCTFVQSSEEVRIRG